MQWPDLSSHNAALWAVSEPERHFQVRPIDPNRPITGIDRTAFDFMRSPGERMDRASFDVVTWSSDDEVAGTIGGLTVGHPDNPNDRMRLADWLRLFPEASLRDSETMIVPMQSAPPDNQLGYQWLWKAVEVDLSAVPEAWRGLIEADEIGLFAFSETDARRLGNQAIPVTSNTPEVQFNVTRLLPAHSVFDDLPVFVGTDFDHDPFALLAQDEPANTDDEPVETPEAEPEEALPDAPEGEGADQSAASASEPETDDQADSDTPDERRDDWGEKIGGARKDEFGHLSGLQAADWNTMIDSGELGARWLNPDDPSDGIVFTYTGDQVAAARKAARKPKRDSIWPAPDPVADLERGQSPVGHWLARIVHTQIARSTSEIKTNDKRDLTSPAEWLVLGGAFAAKTEVLRDRFNETHSNEQVLTLIRDDIQAEREAMKREIDFLNEQITYLGELTDDPDARRHFIEAEWRAFQDQEHRPTLSIDEIVMSRGTRRHRGEWTILGPRSQRLNAGEVEIKPHEMAGQIPAETLDSEADPFEVIQHGIARSVDQAADDTRKAPLGQAVRALMPTTPAANRRVANALHGTISNTEDLIRHLVTAVDSSIMDGYYDRRRDNRERVRDEQAKRQEDIEARYQRQAEMAGLPNTMPYWQSSRLGSSIRMVISNETRLLALDDLERMVDQVSLKLADEPEAGYRQLLGEDALSSGSAADETDDSADQQAADEPTKEIPKVQTIKKPVPPRFKDLKRDGTTRRENDRDVTEEELATTFGLRAIEYGNWVNQAERQSMLNMSFDAFADMAEALDVPRRFMGFDGQLALALGARGQGGRAAAHYEPAREVINLTKTMGAGTLAHEWTHALDHWLFRQAKIEAAEKYPDSIIAGPAGRMGGKDFLTHELISKLPNGKHNQPAKASVETLMRVQSMAGERDGPLVESMLHFLGTMAFRDYDVRLDQHQNGNGDHSGKHAWRIHDQKAPSEAIELVVNGFAKRVFSPKAMDTVSSYHLGSRLESARIKQAEQNGETVDRADIFQEVRAEARDILDRIKPVWQERMAPVMDKIRDTLSVAGADGHDGHEGILGLLFEPPKRGGRTYTFTSEYLVSQVNKMLEEVSHPPLDDNEADFLKGWAEYKDFRWLFKQARDLPLGELKQWTHFAASANTLDNGGKRNYWASSEEMLARGFSTVIHERMRENGTVNDFASRFSAPSQFTPENGYLVSSNPEGDEVALFTKAAMPLIETIQTMAKASVEQDQSADQTEDMAPDEQEKAAGHAPGVA